MKTDKRNCPFCFDPKCTWEPRSAGYQPHPTMPPTRHTPSSSKSLDRLSVAILGLMVCCIGLGFLLGWLARGGA